MIICWHKSFGTQLRYHSKAVTGKSIVFLTLVLLIISGCSKKPKDDEPVIPSAPSIEENIMGDSDSGKAMGLQTINFPFDSFVLTEESKSVLKNNADLLNSKTSMKIQIEGHCDPRGGIQYNIALGEKRANAAKKFLEKLGVSPDRITIISYGKERLLDSGTSEDAFSKNRRDNFVITSR